MGIYRSLSELREDAREMAEKAIAELRDNGIDHIVLETYRPQGVQDAYYAQGRYSYDVIKDLRQKEGLPPISHEEAKRKVTQTKKSKHTERIAIDIVPVLSNGTIPWNIKDASTAALWMSIAEVMKKHGFEWGGDWAPKDRWGIGWDPAHYEI